MSDQIFQDAYTRVRSRYDDQAWFALAPRQITDLIYLEIRLIDGERVTLSDGGFVAVPVAAE